MRTESALPNFERRQSWEERIHAPERMKKRTRRSRHSLPPCPLNTAYSSANQANELDDVWFSAPTKTRQQLAWRLVTAGTVRAIGTAGTAGTGRSTVTAEQSAGTAGTARSAGTVRIVPTARAAGAARSVRVVTAARAAGTARTVRIITAAGTARSARAAGTAGTPATTSFNFLNGHGQCCDQRECCENLRHVPNLDCNSNRE